MPTNFKKVDKLVDKAIHDGLEALGKDVKKRAIILAPYDPERTEPGKHLRSTGKVEVTTNPDTVEISFNKPYAKRRHYENNLHPSTKLYLTQALKSIKNVRNYFKESF